MTRLVPGIALYLSVVNIIVIVIYKYILNIACQNHVRRMSLEGASWMENLESDESVLFCWGLNTGLNQRKLPVGSTVYK